MKKTAYTTLAATILLTSMAFSASSVLADDASDGGVMHSKGTISYVKDESPTNPVDPIDPETDNPITPTDPEDHEKPNAGALSIDYVSNLRFGEHKTTGSEMTYFAELDHMEDSSGKAIDRPNFVQVTDKRGSNAGWNLMVTQDSQFKNGNQELTGAALKLDNATLSTPNDGTEPTAQKSVELTVGEAVDVMSAQADQGTGTWVDRFGKDEEEGKTSVSLTVPGDTKKVQGEYGTSLTWTLTDTPA
ncbi:WxL domain-containing protein [Lactococcus garvieae]|uniref:WxL domain-containing protein n=1 Tax=Lactococcus garvieae TaxID=1363 RepID=UPI00254AA37E|nr:WxL domain-containing protein [Lactococcus garvieae]